MCINNNRNYIYYFRENIMIENYMKLALKEAKKAYGKDEVPIGAVIVKDGKVIAKTGPNFFT